MKTTQVIVATWLLAVPITALVGYETKMYNPPCAYACRDLIAMNPLACSNPMAGMSHAMMHDDSVTPPSCRANDTPFLTTLAYCMLTKCAPYGIKPSLLEKYWEDQATGKKTVPAKWTYAETVSQIKQAPTEKLEKEATLNFTAMLSDDAFLAGYETNVAFEREERTHATYSIVILVTGFGTPILLTLLNHLPFTSVLLNKIRPTLLYRSTIGTYHVRPLPYNIGNAPLLGQSLYIGLMVILNIFLTCLNYDFVDGFTWFDTKSEEIISFIMYRTGVIAFSLFPLLILFSSRNNVLLWLTNWSHSTYLLLHRWIAWIFGIQTLIHSVTALRLYIMTKSFAEEQKLPYWIWGSVATVAMVIMLLFSKLYIRRLSYEIFLISHIVLAVIVLVGCWYHVEIRFMRKFGYEQWLYAACAVWFFDRALRLGRIMKHGVRRAKVTEIGEQYVRVDVPGVRWGMKPGMHVYMYFPTLNPLRPWENHPFSVMPTAMLTPFGKSKDRSAGSISSGSDDEIKEVAIVDEDVEKKGASTTTTAVTKRAHHEHRTTAGLTLFIRKSSGATQRLAAHASLLSLMDGPYPNNPTGHIMKCDRILLLGGGIGITALVPWLHAHPNVKLAWSVKNSARCLVEELADVLADLREKEIRIGENRFDVRELIKQEVHAGWERIGVVCSGPPAMLDYVREVVGVAQRNHSKVRLELHTDAYSW